MNKSTKVSLTMMLTAFLILCNTISLFCQDTIIYNQQDTLYVSYYDEFDYVTNNENEEFIIHHNNDYRYTIDNYGSPIQEYSLGGYTHQIYYGQPDHSVFENNRLKNMHITYVHMHEDLSTTVLEWNCKKDQGWVDTQNRSYKYGIQKLYKGLQGRNHLIYYFLKVTQ